MNWCSQMKLLLIYWQSSIYWSRQFSGEKVHQLCLMSVVVRKLRCGGAASCSTGVSSKCRWNSSYRCDFPNTCELPINASYLWAWGRAERTAPHPARRSLQRARWGVCPRLSGWSAPPAGGVPHCSVHHCPHLLRGTASYPPTLHVHHPPVTKHPHNTYQDICKCGRPGLHFS